MNAKIWNGLLGESSCKDLKTYWENNFLKGISNTLVTSTVTYLWPASTFLAHTSPTAPQEFPLCHHALLMQHGIQAMQLFHTGAIKAFLSQAGEVLWLFTGFPPTCQGGLSCPWINTL